jgi:hypothetical protein
VYLVSDNVFERITLYIFSKTDTKSLYLSTTYYYAKLLFLFRECNKLIRGYYKCFLHQIGVAAHLKHRAHPPTMLETFIIYINNIIYKLISNNPVHFCSLKKHTLTFCLYKSDLPLPDVTVIVSGR